MSISGVQPAAASMLGKTPKRGLLASTSLYVLHRIPDSAVPHAWAAAPAIAKPAASDTIVETVTRLVQPALG